MARLGLMGAVPGLAPPRDGVAADGRYAPGRAGGLIDATWRRRPTRTARCPDRAAPGPDGAAEAATQPRLLEDEVQGTREDAERVAQRVRWFRADQTEGPRVTIEPVNTR
jgi:hypothetical protein